MGRRARAKGANFREFFFRNCPKSLGGARGVALRALPRRSFLSHFVLRIPAKSTLERCSYPFSDCFSTTFVNNSKTRAGAANGPGPLTEKRAYSCCPAPRNVAPPARRIASTPSSGLSSTVVLIDFKCPGVMAAMATAAATPTITSNPMAAMVSTARGP